MLSVASATLIGLPTTAFASQLSNGIAEAGRNFLSTFSDSDEPSTSLKAIDEQSVSAKPIAASNPSKQPSLADLLKAIQSLIQSLSDDSTDQVQIQSLSDTEVQVTGDEPLASSIQQWTKLHPEWVSAWQSYAAKSSKISSTPDSLSPPRKLSAEVTASSVKLNSVDASLLQ